MCSSPPLRLSLASVPRTLRDLPVAYNSACKLFSRTEALHPVVCFAHLTPFCRGEPNASNRRRRVAGSVPFVCSCFFVHLHHGTCSSVIRLHPCTRLRMARLPAERAGRISAAACDKVCPHAPPSPQHTCTGRDGGKAGPPRPHCTLVPGLDVGGWWEAAAVSTAVGGGRRPGAPQLPSPEPTFLNILKGRQSGPSLYM